MASAFLAGVLGVLSKHGTVLYHLGPATGRLLAEMMTGETPFADPGPFAVERFG